MQSDKIKKDQKGFTLVEVLIGLVLLAIGILAVAALQVTSIRGNFNSSNLMQATYIAQERLESLKNLNIVLLPNSGSGTTPNPGMPGFAYNWSFTVVPNGSLKNINCTVTWFNGVNHRIDFSTIRSH